MSMNRDMNSPSGRRRVRGFTLVELMVALVVGLVVTLAAVSFVASVAKANSDNLRVTRLTQELRALSEVMSREIRRARYVADPIGLVAQAGVGNHDRLEVRDQTGALATVGSCIVFEYDEPPDPPAVGGLVTRSIRLENGRIYLNPSAGGGANCSGGSAISSPEVRIASLQFVYDPAISRFRIGQTVVGQLASAAPDLAGLSRTFRQTIYVRSGQVN